MYIDKEAKSFSFSIFEYFSVVFMPLSFKEVKYIQIILMLIMIYGHSIVFEIVKEKTQEERKFSLDNVLKPSSNSKIISII